MSQIAFVVDLDKKCEFQRLLPGMPQTCGMKAGRVYLDPGQSCGAHSTHDREEMLIFLAGSGKAIIEGNEAFDVSTGKVAYIPPQTLHDIKNTGDKPLIYIYCVAAAGQ